MLMLNNFLKLSQ